MTPVQIVLKFLLALFSVSGDLIAVQSGSSLSHVQSNDNVEQFLKLPTASGKLLGAGGPETGRPVGVRRGTTGAAAGEPVTRIGGKEDGWPRPPSALRPGSGKQSEALARKCRVWSLQFQA